MFCYVALALLAMGLPDTDGRAFRVALALDSLVLAWLTALVIGRAAGLI